MYGSGTMQPQDRLRLCAMCLVLLVLLPSSFHFVSQPNITSNKVRSLPAVGRCPFGFDRRSLVSDRLVAQTDFLDGTPLTGCRDGFCYPLPSDPLIGGYFYYGPSGPSESNSSSAHVCIDKLPPPLIRISAAQAAEECFLLATKGKCVEPDFLRGEWCALSCGVCNSPIWVDGITGSYSGPNELLDNGLFDEKRFLAKIPRKTDCIPYDPNDVSAAIKAWATTNPPPANLDLPKLVRAGFHDAADFNKWDGSGGANGNVLTGKEEFYGQTTGFLPKVKSSLAQFKAAFEPALGWADLLQIAAMTAVEIAGGPMFNDFGFEPGRVDAPDEDSNDGLLPNAGPKAKVSTLRDFWYRMGFDDVEIVASMGGHTLGGTMADGDFTTTPDVFNNAYYVGLLTAEAQTASLPCCEATHAFGLVQLSTDRAMLSDPGMRALVELYAANQSAFFADYTQSVRKMSLFGQDTSVQWCAY